MPAEGNLSACELTQGTKAAFLDQGGEAGIAFYKNHVSNLKNSGKAREDMLVALYDSVFKPNS